MIPGIRKGKLQKIITIIFFLFVIYNFFDCLNIELSLNEKDKDLNLIKNFFLFTLFLFELIFFKKLIILLKTKCDIEEYLNGLEHYIYIGEIYTILILKNYTFFSKEQKGNILNICFLLIFGTYFLYVYFHSEKNEERNKLFYTRELELNFLNDALKIEENAAILIESDWGKGKTFFLNEFIKRNKKSYIFIKVKVSLFKNKEEVRKFIFRELEIILNNYNIYGSKIMKILNKIELNKVKPFELLNKEKSLLEEDIESVQKMFNLINRKKIVLILDDIERVPCIKKRKEIISLLSEFEEFVKMKKIVLASKKNLEIELEYLDKYVPIKMRLNELKYSEIVNVLIEDKYKGYYKNVINQILSLKLEKDILNENKIKELEKKFCIPRFINMINIEFQRYNLHEEFDRFKDKEDIIACIIFYELIKNYEENIFERTKENLEIFLFYKEDSFIVKLIKKFSQEKQGFEHKLINFFRYGKILSINEKNQNQTEGIIIKYEEKEKILKNKATFKELSEDLFWIERFGKASEKFYKNFSTAIMMLYKEGYIDIFNFLELVWQSKKVTKEINLEEMEIELEILKKEDSKAKFSKLEKLMWQEYNKLSICLFSLMKTEERQEKFDQLLSSNEEILLSYSSIMMNLGINSDFNKMIKTLTKRIREEGIDENEEIYILLKKNLNFFNKIKQKIDSEIFLGEQEENIKSYEEYTVQELQEKQKEIEEMDEGIYYYKNLLKNAQAVEEFLQKKDED